MRLTGGTRVMTHRRDFSDTDLPPHFEGRAWIYVRRWYHKVNY